MRNIFARFFLIRVLYFKDVALFRVNDLLKLFETFLV